MNIVTGYRGVPHITANEAQAFNQGIFGNGNYVLDVGQKFQATLVDALTVTVADGEGVIQGVHFRIAPGDTDTVSISPGTSGYKRIDYICARYTKSAATGIEDVELVVVEGTPDASTPTAPTINTGDVLNGASPVDFPLWEIDIDGLTPTIVSMNATVGRIIPPPDFASMENLLHEQDGSFSERIRILKDGWYSLFIAKASASTYTYVEGAIYWSSINSANLLACIGRNSNSDIYLMTPWFYFKAGDVLYIKGYAQDAFLKYAPWRE